MTTINCVAGDTGDERTLALNGVDLTTATGAEAHVWPVNGPGTAVTCPVTLNAVDGTGTVSLGTFLGTATATVYYLEIEVTFPGGPLTWPSGQPDRINVRQQGDTV